MRKLILLTAAAALLAGCSTSPYFVKHNGNKISFYAKISKAKSVYFVSSATNFKKIKAKEIQNGLWKASVPYKKGIIKYFYIVNDKVFVPQCKTKQKDGFGGIDCVYVSKNM